ncbi:MAG: glycosyltransferase [Desulfocapsaceae bacterium]|nr:glycosyltransferase [Desulfocapsaceae bacterium]
MNIAYFSDQYWPSISGVSVSIDAFKKQLTLMGHRTALFVPEYPGSELHDQKEQLKDVFRFRSYKVLINDENRLVYRSEKKKIFSLLDEFQPQIIHVHTEFSLGKIATHYAKKRKIKLVMTAHTNWEQLIHHYLPLIPTFFGHLCCRAYMRHIYNKADVLVVPTSLMEILLSFYFVKTPVRIIPTGVDISLFKNETQGSFPPPSETFPVLKDKKYLFFAGRLSKEKNIPFLIDVFAMLKPRHADLMLIISGDGPARESLQEYAAQAGLADSIVFTGYVEHANLGHFYRNAEAFIFASKVESQGMVALESMACGTPVVAIGKMGTREVMGGDLGGFMVDDDMHEFAEKVELLLNSPEIRNAKAETARRHAGSWTIEVEARKMLKLYTTLLEGHAESPSTRVPARELA